MIHAEGKKGNWPCKVMHRYQEWLVGSQHCPALWSALRSAAASQVLRQAKPALEPVIDGEANGCGGDHLGTGGVTDTEGRESAGRKEFQLTPQG